MIVQEQVHKNYQAVLKQIAAAAERAGRLGQDVSLVVVTKGHPVEAVQAVIAAGARKLGENYVEAAIPKIERIKSSPGSDVEWHMIGHIQSRKAQAVCQHFDYVHSLDSLKLAIRLDRFASEMNIRLPVLLECNVSGEDTKFGFSASRESDLPVFMAAVAEISALPQLAVRGLMTMAPFFDDPQRARPYFRRLMSLKNQLSQQFPQIDWRELSMGMSGDFQVAIEEGATLVRIGTAIMGPRPDA